MANKEKSPDSEAQAYHHGRLKEALKTVALESVQESGEKGLTFRELARRTGVTHTAPYAHYKNKDALLAAVATGGALYMTPCCAAACSLLTAPLRPTSRRGEAGQLMDRGPFG